MAGEIKVNGRDLTIDHKRLDAIVATMCFAFGDPGPERDEMVKAEIAKCCGEFVAMAMATSSLYERLNTSGSRAVFAARFTAEMTKRYRAAGYLGKE